MLKTIQNQAILSGKNDTFASLVRRSFRLTINLVLFPSLLDWDLPQDYSKCEIQFFRSKRKNLRHINISKNNSFETEFNMPWGCKN